MNSSQIASVVGAATVIVAALVLTSAQTRVLARNERRLPAYLTAWVVCTLVLGVFIWLTELMVGKGSLRHAVRSILMMGVATGFALLVNDRVVDARRRLSPPPGRLATLLIFAVHMVVLTLLFLI